MSREAALFEQQDTSSGASAGGLHSNKCSSSSCNGSGSSSSVHVTLLTSCTRCYRPGPLCVAVNRAYAERQGYGFVFDDQPERAIDSAKVADYGQHYRPAWGKASENEERHPTWRKVELVNHLLELLLPGSSGSSAPEQRLQLLGQMGCPPQTTHLMWVDADALVVQQQRRVEELLSTAGPEAELIVGEDLTLNGLINAGVFIVRVSNWSRELWGDVWSSPKSSKFFQAKYHEQSALLRQLADRRVPLRQTTPFHSYDRNGPQGPKVFGKVVVMPRRAMNTNQEDCNFIFHAAGRVKALGGKMPGLRIMLLRNGLGDFWDAYEALQLPEGCGIANDGEDSHP